MTGGALQQKVAGELLACRVDAFDLTDFFDEKAQRDLDHGAVQGGPAHAGGQSDVADLAQESAGEGSERADDPLGQRQDVLVGHDGLHGMAT